MKRLRRLMAATLLIVCAVGLLAPPRAQAFIEIPFILVILDYIDDALKSVILAETVIQRGLQGGLFGTFATVFNTDVFADLGLAFQEVYGIKTELQKLACGWRFTGRMLQLEDLFKPVRWCKPNFQLVWGSGEFYWDSDLQELHDAVGSLTYNAISDRTVKENGSWELAFPMIAEATANAWTSPGMANRTEAISLAAADLVAQSNGRMETQRLLLRATDGERKRFKREKAVDIALGIYGVLSGGSSGGAQP